MLWRSKSMSAALGPPRLPTRKTRLRRCGTGPLNPPHDLSNTLANCESNVLHATKYPQSSSSSSRHPKSRPLLLERHPGTFSQMMYLGLPPPGGSHEVANCSNVLVHESRFSLKTLSTPCDGERLARASSDKNVNCSMLPVELLPIDLAHVAQVRHVREPVGEDC